MTEEKQEDSILVTHDRPAPDEYATSAKQWALWDSATHPMEPPGSNTFHFVYNGDYDIEKCLIVTGTATLTPSDGSEKIAIQAGDSVWFHHGFACDWEVHTPMTKHYEYFDNKGNVKKPAAIACDNCGVDCESESYLVGGEEDFCPTCYAKGNYTNGEHQRMGKAIEEELEPPSAKKARTK